MVVSGVIVVSGFSLISHPLFDCPSQGRGSW
jgi:hypothetical protein